MCSSDLVARMLEMRQPTPDQGFVAHQEGKVRRGLAAIQAGLGEGWLFEDFGLADIAVAAAVGYVGLRGPALLAERPVLLQRYAEWCERPSIGATLPG